MNETRKRRPPSNWPERSGGQFDGGATGGSPSPEVPERPTRRRFTAEYKVRVVEEAEACTEPGEIGALLRREGLWSSSLSRWRRQYRAGALKSMKQRKRGPRAPAGGAVARENKELKQRVTRLERRLRRAEKLLEIQKKVSEILGVSLESADESESA